MGVHRIKVSCFGNARAFSYVIDHGQLCPSKEDVVCWLFCHSVMIVPTSVVEATVCDVMGYSALSLAWLRLRALWWTTIVGSVGPITVICHRVITIVETESECNGTGCWCIVYSNIHVGAFGGFRSRENVLVVYMMRYEYVAAARVDVGDRTLRSFWPVTKM